MKIGFYTDAEVKAFRDLFPEGWVKNNYTGLPRVLSPKLAKKLSSTDFRTPEDYNKWCKAIKAIDDDPVAQHIYSEVGGRFGIEFPDGSKFYGYYGDSWLEVKDRFVFMYEGTLEL